MPEYDIVIKGGTVIDGLRTPRYKADVAIKDGRIVQIGSVDASDGAEVVDASGKIVAPGFVDLHTHYDSQVFWDPWCTMSGWHGVTSVVIGNCGFGFAPCKPEDRDRAMLSLSRNEAVPLKTMQAGHAVGLGDVPGVPRQRRPHAQGRERHGVRAARAALRVRRRRRQGQGAPRHRRRARRDVPAPRRGAWRRVAAVGARRSSARSATCSSTTTARRWSPTHDRARGRRLLPRAARGRPRRHPAHRLARHRGAHRARERPADHLERAARRRRAQPARWRGVLAPRRARSSSRTTTRRKGCASSRRRCTDRTSSRSSRFEDYNLLDTIPVLEGGAARYRRGEAGQARRSRAACRA